MNIANQITIARIIMIPVFIIFLLVPMHLGTLSLGASALPVSVFISGLIFIIASCTDWLDGYYARKYNLVTTFGKFLDPLADKLLVMSALVSLVALELVPAWMVIVILAREFAVTGLRTIAASDGEVIAASGIAKWKTTTQMVAIILLLFYNVPFGLDGFPLALIFLWISVILTIISGWDYFYKNRRIILKSH